MSRILVIEDELNIRRFVTINFKARGHTVEEAGTGTEGLELLRTTSPDVLILDMMLPDMTGWQVLETMSQEDALKTIPVILMTASVNVGDSLKYANVVQHVMKPASVTVLLDALQNATT
jgi:CheY-like chemotaxis protein